MKGEAAQLRAVAAALEDTSNEDLIADGSISTAKLADGAITKAKLGVDAGFAALIAAGLGVSQSYAKALAGAANLLFTQDATARVVLVVVHVDEVMAAGSGTAPTYKIGEVDTPEKFIAAATIAGKAAGSILVAAGALSANKNLIVTNTPAVGNGTGGITVTVLILPAAA